MSPELIVKLFSEEDSKESAFEYLKAEGVVEMIESHPQQDIKRFVPDYPDLARLHSAVRSRKVFTILEFGLGYSTITMAHALLKNKQEWGSLSDKPPIENATPFQIHAVDTSEKWIAQTRQMLPTGLDDIVHLYYSTASAGTFQGRVCHFYDCLPNVVPDLIYLDGPDPTTVKGQISGLDWSNRDRVVMAGDLLRMEPHLLPGTLVIVDGRSANSRFLKYHMYRSWGTAYNADACVSAFELQEAPLSKLKISREKMLYCLGDRIEAWAGD